MENNRRSFIKQMTMAGLGTVVATELSQAAVATSAPQKDKKKTAGKDDGKLRFGFIGTGHRAEEHIKNVITIPGNKIVAICDIQAGPIQRTLAQIDQYNLPAPKVYTGDEYAFEKMLNNEEFDCVIISTPWEWHTPMAVAAMKAGVPYVGVEVSAANSLDECWDLVNVSEETGSQLNILENDCYDRECMAVLNMVRQGLFGELLHICCGYQHDLRGVKFNDGVHYDFIKGGELRMGPTAFCEAQWRTNHSVHRNGDLYPTHGIGPMANCLDINRGNRFISLSAMATQSRGLHKFIVDNGGEHHPLAKVRFNCGDIVTSMIKCANGQTIIVTHDTNSPRPHVPGFRVQGTEGLWMSDGHTIYVENQCKPHTWDDDRAWLKKYDHPMWIRHEEQAKGTGHGGVDYMVMYDFVQAIRNKQPAPMDCYDAAAWSAISALSEMSIAQGGIAVDFPDFTRTKWINRKPTFAIEQ